MATAESEDNISDESSSSTSTPTRPSTSKKQKVHCKSYTQKFRHEWLQLSEFKGWLKQPTTNKSKPTCTVCSTTITCTKTGIKRHGKSATHSKFWKNSVSVWC